YSLLPTPYSLLPTPYSLLPTPYSLKPSKKSLNQLSTAIYKSNPKEVIPSHDHRKL
ncbi:MAG: hypothetical protein F6J94_32060, partial [Moorea sp. SIO1F2]|nr:hypothetical protein [Moorena sp. SIO1F2]